MSNTLITKDDENHSVSIERTLATSKQDVWDAWSTQSQLEAWWGPANWRTESDNFSFSENGTWDYRMVGPDGTVAAGRLTFLAIDAPNSFTFKDAFRNEDGSLNTTLPVAQGRVTLVESNNATVIKSVLMFDSAEDMATVINMGFEAGYSQSLDRLEALLIK